MVHKSLNSRSLIHCSNDLMGAREETMTVKIGRPVTIAASSPEKLDAQHA